MVNVSYRIILLAFIATLLSRCASESPFAHISFDQYEVADGFELELVAAEPFVESPVAIDFDDKGRIWVLEMRGFMPDVDGTGEDVPNGRISILEDFDKNGIAKQSKVFIDDLVLPRALALVYGGVLYAEPPNLWFVEIEDDKPGKRILVDSLYADEFSNPENQANGLKMAVDNWIYSAFSSVRYRMKDGEWIHEPTTFRGQFGITTDDFGRLYYNYNEVQIVGDYVLPNTVINNPYLKPAESINKPLTENQNVYPLHPTTVNRGYVHGILNGDSILKKFTASCGPLIYRGDQFPEDYYQNAFACEPQANLIKRNILTFSNLETTAKQAWDDREFIASTDEAFRPVNLANGPDGAMYVADMHHGVMQHIISATPYYKRGIVHKELDTIINRGRILRVKNKNKPLGKIPDFDRASPKELVELLKIRNGWIRDRAQQILVYKKSGSDVVPQLKNLIKDGENTVAAIHSLYILEGIDSLSFDFLKEVAENASDPWITSHALLLIDDYKDASLVEKMKGLAGDVTAKRDTLTDLYLAISLRSWIDISPSEFLPVLAELSERYHASPVYQEAVVSSLENREVQFKKFLNSSNGSKMKDQVIDKILKHSIKNKQDNEMNSIFVEKIRPTPGLQKGLVIYRSNCSGCHGPDGDGIQHIGPPLRGSQYVSGSVARLGLIILNGLEGPVQINEQKYEFNGSMPSFRDIYSDEEIAGIIDFLHNSFIPADPKLSYGRKRVNPLEIQRLRKVNPGILNEESLAELSEKLETEE